ncbi:alpha-crystallin A chain-like [Bradysia coprophila]|uniref:alpha-crystallin A chain-like n=1 Tax=Bradysia coprophila TaxID=38358 RepID=UPI00187D8EE2|nr:alpha-crystallin A chain-like [Bradysia coprophila]
MSLVPYDYDNDWLDFKRRVRFNTDITPSDLLPTPASWAIYRSICSSTGSVRPWMDSNWSNLDGMEREVHVTKDIFQVSLDVRHFKSYEISVKVVNNSIVIEGRHDKRPQIDGYVARKFERRFDLAKVFKIRDVNSTLSTDGILTVTAYPEYPTILPNVRHVPVVQTFRPSHWD